MKNKSNKPKIQVDINGKTNSFLPQQISVMILEYLKKAAEDYIGQKVCNAVINVTAYFNEEQKKLQKNLEQLQV